MLGAGSDWLALLQYAVVAVQGSAVAQVNLAWLLQHSPAYDMQYKAKVCMRLLTQAGKGELADAWVDAGSMEYKSHQLGMSLQEPTTAVAVSRGLTHTRNQMQNSISQQRLHQQMMSRSDVSCSCRC